MTGSTLRFLIPPPIMIDLIKKEKVIKTSPGKEKGQCFLPSPVQQAQPNGVSCPLSMCRPTEAVNSGCIHLKRGRIKRVNNSFRYT